MSSLSDYSKSRILGQSLRSIQPSIIKSVQTVTVTTSGIYTILEVDPNKAYCVPSTLVAMSEYGDATTPSQTAYACTATITDSTTVTADKSSALPDVTFNVIEFY